MKGGDVNEFLETLHTCMELVFSYNNQTFMVQALRFDNIRSMLLDRWEPPSDNYVWRCDQNIEEDYSDCVKKFLEEKIFDGKSFWEIEQDIEWLEG